jgi:hypothetical protein
MYADIGRITEADALSEPPSERLFAEPLVLTPDLVSKGFKLIIRTPKHMFAVSEAYGCTGTKAMIGAVISEARSLVSFCQSVNRRRTEQ